MWAAVGSAVCLALSSPPQRLVVGPLAATVLLAMGLLAMARGGSRTPPLSEIGIWHGLAVAAYTALPVLSYILLGLTYTPLNDARLYGLQPSAELVGRIGWMHVAYLAAFGATYLIAAGRRPLPTSLTVHVKTSLALSAALLAVASMGATFLIRLYYGTHGGTYTGSYEATARLPLAIRQLLRLLTGPRLFYWLVLLTWAFQRYQRRRGLIVFALLIVLIATVVGAGARADFMLIVLSTVILYHRMVRPISYGRAAAFGVLALLSFTALGILRQLATSSDFGTARLVSSGEFESVFANNVDLATKRDWHEIPPPTERQYLSEFLAPIPSQVLPFDKLDASNWYVSTFYPTFAAAGGGFAFGVVAQALVGFGLPELLLRAVFAGLLFAVARTVLGSRHGGVWTLVTYTWLSVTAYQSFRAGTLYPFNAFIHDFPPALFTLAVLTIIFRRACRPGRGARLSVPNRATSS
jgi:hypothetical protein